LSRLAKNPDGALRGIRNLVAECIQDLKDDGEEIPDPISCRKYSGKFMIRVPPDVHRDLALKAAEAGVSLNRLASAKLSRQRSPQSGIFA